ncbi:hypothetical protein NEIFLAOT_00807 [Neisseria flavescens NRL30031/H210]|uniref:Uncharacterized protein n=1 Tax=Neisseria flavescens NRL30031/H210 TaxID=546264 RepID=C0ELK2_NEIFL|nr:hypothetical protein NEIFLAOT_00807 [Neisseria flavescens NRL30031/H210]
MAQNIANSPISAFSNRIFPLIDKKYYAYYWANFLFTLKYAFF